ncbi:TonB-dependent receptor [Maricurvus nonylphenolicus]|uniref:TonB-dependent receptor n=1 Tax=Maricurvus nonylphenolicus TaxID=1008307 RepID=UPI0036F204A9
MKIISKLSPLFIALSMVSGVKANQTLEEVIVTAQKRSQSAQDVPIAITALSGDALEKKNILAVTDLEKHAPGLRIPQQDASKTYIRVRGVGSRKFDVGSEGSVGVFVDEIYMPRFSGADIGLLDLSGVEVLKGPQGTLFGRNTAAGAINISTLRPSEEHEGYIEAGVGNKGSYSIRGGVSGAIGDNVNVRLSAGQGEQGGFQENPLSGEESDFINSAVRLQADFTVSDSLYILAAMQYTEREQNALLQKSISTASDNTIAPLFGTLNVVNPGPPPVTTPHRFDVNTKFRDTPVNHDGSFDSDSLFASLRIEKDFGGFSLTSITGIQDYESLSVQDFDGSSAMIGLVEMEEDTETFSQELRLSNDNFIFGVYYYIDDVESQYRFSWESESLQSFLNSALSLGYSDFSDNTPIDVKTTSWAVFGEYRLELSENLALTVGGRYSEDEKDFELRGETVSPGLPVVIAPYSFSDKENWDSFDPRISLTYQLSNDILAYATYSEGYKAGGVQFTAVTETMAQAVFDPEELTAYEIGIKSDLLEKTLRLNASMFLYDYQDLQVQRVQQVNVVPPVSAALTQNAAESEIKGFEIEANWIPAEGFDFRMAYAFLDAEYESFGEFTGNTLPVSPEHTVMFSLNYNTTLNDSWELTLGTDWSWTDDYNFDVTENDPYTQQESYTLGALHMGLTSPDQKWTVSAFVENLTDEEYYSQMTRRSDEVLATPADGRRYGLRLRYSY